MLAGGFRQRAGRMVYQISVWRKAHSLAIYNGHIAERPMEADPVAARRIRAPARPGLTRAASATPGQAPPATSLTYGIPNRVTLLGGGRCRARSR
jgi:hypothetical protein